ncbi:hypothetical protein SV7mr_37460 [Stieleria bergensis]|uniref:Uncharacterized protein n=1 Tax=Stieleria bergensis TaxID=2528025 RepID=A0A517SYP2_9BACT|nr:hypothetical protein SV7mr_37460 [Planctomycetes bacterium SV_7m_r]
MIPLLILAVVLFLFIRSKPLRLFLGQRKFVISGHTIVWRPFVSMVRGRGRHGLSCGRLLRFLGIPSDVGQRPETDFNATHQQSNLGLGCSAKWVAAWSDVHVQYSWLSKYRFEFGFGKAGPFLQRLAGFANDISTTISGGSTANHFCRGRRSAGQRVRLCFSNFNGISCQSLPVC